MGVAATIFFKSLTRLAKRVERHFLCATEINCRWLRCVDRAQLFRRLRKPRGQATCASAFRFFVFARTFLAQPGLCGRPKASRPQSGR